MMMHDRRELADQAAIGKSADEVMAWCVEIGGRPLAIDRMIEHVGVDGVERGGIGGIEPPDLDGHRRPL